MAKEAKAPKQVSLTQEQFKILKQIMEDAGEVRRRLYNIDDADTVSKLAFAAGAINYIADKMENDLIDLVEQIDPYDVFTDF